MTEFTQYFWIKQAGDIGRPEDDGIVGSSAITQGQIIQPLIDIWVIECPKYHAGLASGSDSNGGTDSTMESVPVPTLLVSNKQDSNSGKNWSHLTLNLVCLLDYCTTVFQDWKNPFKRGNTKAWLLKLAADNRYNQTTVAQRRSSLVWKVSGFRVFKCNRSTRGRNGFFHILHLVGLGKCYVHSGYTQYGL